MVQMALILSVFICISTSFFLHWITLKRISIWKKGILEIDGEVRKLNVELEKTNKELLKNTRIFGHD